MRIRFCDFTLQNICDISFDLFFRFASLFLLFFQSNPYSWESIIPYFSRLRSKIERGELSLLDLRNYLFSRQALLLIQLKNEDELARRCLSFLYNTLQVLIYNIYIHWKLIEYYSSKYSCWFCRYFRTFVFTLVIFQQCLRTTLLFTTISMIYMLSKQ